MITLADAFKKFKSRLELNDKQQADASRRQKEVRAFVADKFSVEDSFLSGSYARWTKTRPLKDVDIFVVLDADDEAAYLKGNSQSLIDDVEKHLKGKYGAGNVSQGRRCVQITFGERDPGEEGLDDNVMSIDVIPAFVDPEGYKIPDPKSKAGWCLTNPKIHYDKAVTANEKFSGEWKPLVKMLKKWNEHHGKPIKPSFLIEVMALDILCPPFSGGYQYEIKGFFATAAARIHETWNDPAGLGPPVSEQMDSGKIESAKTALRSAEKNVTEAIRLANLGRNGDALKIWRDNVFGPKFPLS
jgi:predicted nucleotidyltransferase